MRYLIGHRLCVSSLYLSQNCLMQMFANIYEIFYFSYAWLFTWAMARDTAGILIIISVATISGRI